MLISLISLISLIWNDVNKVYPKNNLLKKAIGILINPSLHAVILIRLQLHTGIIGYWFFRNVLITKHGIDVGKGALIGAGLYLPHPLNIVIGKGCTIGHSVTIYQGVTVGQKSGKYPTLGSGVCIYPNAVVIGDIKVAENKIIRATEFVYKNDF